MAKDDELFHVLISFLPWEWPIINFPPKDFPTYGALYQSVVFPVLSIPRLNNISEFISG